MNYTNHPPYFPLGLLPLCNLQVPNYSVDNFRLVELAVDWHPKFMHTTVSNQLNNDFSSNTYCVFGYNTSIF